jgi:colanic acid/amylovoran biosynthesis glycosyltransferase
VEHWFLNVVDRIGTVTHLIVGDMIMSDELKEKKILFISEIFPRSEKKSISGIFIKQQIDSIKNKLSQINVISPASYISIRSYAFSFVRKNKKIKDYSYNNVNVYFPRALHLSRDVSKNNLINRKLQAIVKTINRKTVCYDLIHAHFGIDGLLITKLAKKTHKPFIVSFYGYDAYRYEFEGLFYRDLFQTADCILALSDHMSKRLEKLGCPITKIKKHHLGIDIEKFQPKKKISNNDHKNIKILLVAHFVEKKGILNAIKAFSLAYQENQNIYFEIVGRGPLKPQIEKLINDLGLQKHIQMINNYETPSPRKTVLDLMQKCDIFILPSITASDGDCEGTPVVLMEASACGKPIITTFHSGNPEVVLDKYTGYVVPENDIEQLAGALTKLIDDKELREQFGRNARNHAINEFNAKKQGEKLLEIYKGLI